MAVPAARSRIFCAARHRRLRDLLAPPPVLAERQHVVGEVVVPPRRRRIWPAFVQVGLADLATVHSLTITLIAAVYVGFAVADGRPRVIAVETSVALLFLLIAATAVTGSAWLLVIGYFGHGCKDLWQHRTQFVTGTRWWPPFCAAVDWVVAGSIAVLILAGVQFH